MSVRPIHGAALFLALILVAKPATHADIYRWDNGDVIPGTEGVSTIELHHKELAYADLSGLNLTRADLNGATLVNARMRGVHMSGANLSADQSTHLGGTNLDRSGRRRVIVGSRLIVRLQQDMPSYQRPGRR